MNTEETKQVVFHINEGVDKIKRRININTVIFSLSFLILLWTIWMGYKLSAKQERNYDLALASMKQTAEVNAKLDATQSLYTNYIKTTVGLILDKLQKDNPQVIVPKAPEPRPPGVPVSEQELERPRKERPKPIPTATISPIVKTRTIVKYRRPKPTPRPWYQFWNPKQTR